MALKKKLVNEITPNIRKLVGQLPDIYERAAGITGLALIGDAGNKAPTPPKKTGLLRSSWFLYSQGKQAAKGKDAEVPNSISYNKKQIVATVGYATPYAKKLHERLLEPGEEKRKGYYAQGPGSIQAGNVGPFWLSSKMIQMKDRYAKIFASRVKKFIKESEQ
jgi:hypothetical protein